MNLRRIMAEPFDAREWAGLFDGGPQPPHPNFWLLSKHFAECLTISSHHFSTTNDQILTNQTQNMAQNMLAEVLRHYHILASNTPDMIELTDELMQEVGLVPQGIPALYEYSDRFAGDHGRAKELVNAFFNPTARHRGRFLDVLLAPLIFVLVYLFTRQWLWMIQ